jgi:hypothetical protein
MKPTRKEALAAGENNYYTGKPCSKGHISARRAKTGECLECRKLFLVNWRKKNPDKVAKHNKNQYAKFSEDLALRSRIYYAANKEECRAKSRKYQKENLHIYAAINAKYSAAKLKRTPSWLTDDDLWLIKQFYELAALRTKVTGISWHVDHVIPLQGKYVSGLHVPLNLQVIPAELNLSKSNRFSVK